MDSATKGFWDKVVHELQRLNRTLEELLKFVDRPRQQHNPAVEDQAYSNNATDPASGKMALDFHVRPSPKQQPGPQKKRYQSFDWWKSRLEVAAYIFAVVYAVITYFQWRDLRHNFMVDERAWVKIGSNFPKLVDFHSGECVGWNQVGDGELKKQNEQ